MTITAPSEACSSILFPEPAPLPVERDAPACFADLNLHRIVARIAAGPWAEYGLPRLYHDAPTDRRVIDFRQAVMRDTERADVRHALLQFSERMRAVRRQLALHDESDYPLEAARFFLGAVEAYVDAVGTLHRALALLPLDSAGLQRWREALAVYAESAAFRGLAAECAATAEGLARVTYIILLDGLQVTVLPYDGLPNYAIEIERLFARFRGEATTDAPSTPFDAGRLNRVEAQILDRVARLAPAPFDALIAFVAAHPDFQDPRITRFDGEVPYYLAYGEAIAPLRQHGLSFAYPVVSAADKTLELEGAFDLALAWELRERALPIVTTDVALAGRERLMVVSGPNSGGKTTFARMIGQVHYLARLGFPVPGRMARCFIVDRILTHFERVEDLRRGHGKLQDDLLRIRRILDDATPASLVVMNEIFASTTVHDALYLARRILRDLSARDLLAVCVTFLDELSTFDDKTVSFVAGVEPTNPSIRTFRMERRLADGRAYALAVAAKHRVTREWLLRRLPA
ncbi:MAG: DNA mismatch repair protein MutS [Gemmatimonadota bacterium]|nr:DNA mismatch repair protein MutS [Gemmatimonadota bacterium]